MFSSVSDNVLRDFDGGHTLEYKSVPAQTCEEKSLTS